MAPVLAEYRGQWPIYAILKQYLGTHSRTRTKDLAMEAEEENGPDRDAIRMYFKQIGVPPIRHLDMHSDDDELSQEGDEESSDDEEESDREAKVLPEIFYLTILTCSVTETQVTDWEEAKNKSGSFQAFESSYVID